MYDVTRGLQKNGQFLLNTIFDADELEKFMPNKVKKYFAQNNITVYTINATKIAQEIGLGNRTNTILQSAFFRITGVIPVELAVEKMKAAALKSYGAKGQDVVDKNYAAIDRGGEYTQLTVKPEWANLPDDEVKADNAPAFVKEVVRPIRSASRRVTLATNGTQERPGRRPAARQRLRQVRHCRRFLGGWYCCLREAWCRGLRSRLEGRDHETTECLGEGTRTTVSSVTSVPTSVLTLP